MQKLRYSLCLLALAGLTVPASATVTILTLGSAPKPPQPLGTDITLEATATDSNTSGLLTFQFTVTDPLGSVSELINFNAGTLSGATWTSQPYEWTPTGIEGAYTIEVIAQDWATGESATKAVTFQVDPLVSGNMPVATRTANPLVGLFSTPSCAAGSAMRVSFQEASGAKPATVTPYQACHPPGTMNFEIAGMYPSTVYSMFSQTNTGGALTNGPAVTFKTGALPADIPFPAVTVKIPAGSTTDTADSVLLLSALQGVDGSILYPDVATDLTGAILWYYYPSSKLHSLLTRPLQDNTMLVIEDGTAWNPVSIAHQRLNQVDLGGSILRETNTGILQQELLALGATDAAPCNIYPSPAPVGSACLGAFHHDDIQTLPNGYTAVLVDIEKIFPPGTQGDPSGLPVDIIGDMIVVLDRNWQAVWYFDAFQHDSGPPQLDISRPAVLGETCEMNQGGCPPIFLLGPGIAPRAHDWLHGNSIYYWPQTGDLVWSSRHQDWVMRTDYNNGTGTGNILWRLGPCGDFTFNNIYDDPWPWNSHQHDAGIQNSGAGPLTLFDNGNTRVSAPSTSTGCLPGVGSGDSRGMALSVDETALLVTPVLSQDLAYFSEAYGSAQLLSDGNYFFLAGHVPISPSLIDSYSVEFLPIAGTAGGTQVLSLQGTESYRAWRMTSLYNPPVT